MEFLNRLIVVHDFTPVATETTDLGDCCELAIFVRYVDSDLHELEEKCLGMVEVVGSKGEKPYVLRFVVGGEIFEWKMGGKKFGLQHHEWGNI